MGGPPDLKPIPIPKTVDQTKTMLDAFKFADTEAKIRKSGGRAGMFQTTPRVFSPGSGMLGS
jgi:hypothetical protein